LGSGQLMARRCATDSTPTIPEWAQRARSSKRNGWGEASSRQDWGSREENLQKGPRRGKVNLPQLLFNAPDPCHHKHTLTNCCGTHSRSIAAASQDDTGQVAGNAIVSIQLKIFWQQQASRPPSTSPSLQIFFRAPLSLCPMPDVFWHNSFGASLCSAGCDAPEAVCTRADKHAF
jgi:hypothetical protein